MGRGGARQPERFGKYQLLKRIGVGGMAEVFWAKTHGAQGFVKELVIKRILPALSADPEFVKMFINEAHIAARLHHANVVQIFDFDHVDGVYYIAMEWVDGVDLRKIQATAARRSMPVPFNVAIHIGVEVLKGLHYAHSRVEHGEQLQLVHRDISPHNLLVSFAGEVKIADFGIAKIAAAASTRTGMIKGKLAYMSPEQVNGVPVDASTDIFALGVVLWELVANRRLYAATTTDAELLSAVGRAEIPPISSINPEVEPSIDNIISRMVARDQAARYQTATEALADLSELGAVAEELLVADYLRALLPAEAEREQMDKTAIDDSPGYREALPAAPTETRYSQGLQRAEPEVDDEAETKEVSGPVAEVLATAPTLLNTNPGVDPPESAITRIPIEQTGGSSPPVRRPLLIALVVAVPLFAVVGWFLGGVAGQDEPPQQAVALPDATIFAKAEAARPRATTDGSEGSSRRDDAAVGSNQEPQSQPVGRRRPNVRRAQPTRARTVRGEGTINIVVSPWAKVRIDGVSVGITPVLARQLRVGHHLVELQNAALKRRERVRIRILANRKMTIRRDWTK